MPLYRPTALAYNRNVRATTLIYPLSPLGNETAPTAPPVIHYLTAAGNVVCGQRGSAWRPQTRDPDRATCPFFRRWLQAAL